MGLAKRVRYYGIRYIGFFSIQFSQYYCQNCGAEEYRSLYRGIRYVGIRFIGAPLKLCSFHLNGYTLGSTTLYNTIS